MRVLDPVPIQNIVGRENLYLECSGSGNPSPKIEWSLNGVRFIPNKLMDGTDPTETNKVRHELGSNSLIIRDVRGSTDSGRYRCIVTNSIGSVFMEKNITIRVMGVFTAGNRFHNVQRKLYPTVGKKFFIECPPHSKGYGNKYRWGVVPRSLSPQYWLAGRPFDHIFPMSDGRLAYAVVKLSDIKQSRDIGGVRCILLNYGIITASVQMMLWQPYKIVKELRKPDLVQSMAPRMEAPVNSEFAMICGATGDPVPTIKWWYQGVILKSRWNNGSTELNFEFFRLYGANRELKLRRVTRYSGGAYRCFAENSLGVVWRDGMLTVLFPPEW